MDKINAKNYANAHTVGYVNEVYYVCTDVYSINAFLRVAP